MIQLLCVHLTQEINTQKDNLVYTTIQNVYIFKIISLEIFQKVSIFLYVQGDS